jgi:hypothetical protein
MRGPWPTGGGGLSRRRKKTQAHQKLLRDLGDTKRKGHMETRRSHTNGKKVYVCARARGIFSLQVRQKLLPDHYAETVRQVSKAVLAGTLAHQLVPTAYRRFSLTVQGKKYIDGQEHVPFRLRAK